MSRHREAREGKAFPCDRAETPECVSNQAIWDTAEVGPGPLRNGQSDSRPGSTLTEHRTDFDAFSA